MHRKIAAPPDLSLNPGGAAPFESISERVQGITGYGKKKELNPQTFEMLEFIPVQMNIHNPC
jgi:hypothetical protein